MLPTPPSASRRILVVTLADLGDALLTIPALSALRAALPTARITLLTTPLGATALRDLPLYDAVVVFDKQRFNRPRDILQSANLRYGQTLWQQLRAGCYDDCVILHHLTTWFGTLKYAALAAASGARRRWGLENGRGWFLTDRVPDEGFGARHQAEYWLALVERLTGRAPATRTAPLSRIEADETPPELAALPGSGPLIALHPGSGAFAPARRWPSARFAALADALIADGAQIVLVGGAEERELRQSMLAAMRHADAVLDLGGQTSLAALGRVLGACRLFVGNDSGLAHLAASAGAPVVAIFGPTDPRAWGPYGGEPWHAVAEATNGVALLASGPHRALSAQIACRPCIYRGHRLGTPEGCPDRTCLLRIDVDQALAVVRRRLLELANQRCVSTI